MKYVSNKYPELTKLLRKEKQPLIIVKYPAYYFALAPFILTGILKVLWELLYAWLMFLSIATIPAFIICLLLLVVSIFSLASVIMHYHWYSDDIKIYPHLKWQLEIVNTGI